MPRDLGEYNRCRVIKANGYRCGCAEMVNGQYAGVGVCYIHIAQALMQGKTRQQPDALIRRGTLRLVEAR
jgi:hypothetical protein